MIEEQLRSLMRRKEWGLLYIGVSDFDAFTDVSGFVAGDEVLRFTALLLGEVDDKLGGPDDFIGHIGGDDFILITTQDRAAALAEAARQRFSQEIGSHYSFKDRERGYAVEKDAAGTERHVPLMKLCVGVVLARDYEFTDIREITEVSAELRRKTCS
jgi:GGDEF domain-containing protein